MLFQILKADEDLNTGLICYFLWKKPLEDLIAALRMKSNCLILHVYNRESLFCHLECSTAVLHNAMHQKRFNNHFLTSINLTDNRP